MIRIGNKNIGRAILKDINVSGIYLGPKLVWGREVELLQMFKASVLADGGVYDEELFTSEFFRVDPLIRNEAVVLVVCGAYKSGIIYGINCVTGQAVPLTFGRASVGTYFDKNGIMQTVAANIPRIDYSPDTVVLRGYALEKSKTNVVLRGNSLTNSPWSSGSNNAVTYDPVDNAFEVNSSSVSGQRLDQSSIPVAENTVYTFSFYAKNAGSNETINLSVVDFSNEVPIINLQNYAGDLNSDSYTRVFATFTTPPGCSIIRAYLVRSGPVVSGLKIKNVQIENSHFPTSYADTGAGQVTQAKDNLTIPDPIGEHGSVFMESAFPDLTGISADHIYRTTNGRFALRTAGIDNSRIQATDGVTTVDVYNSIVVGSNRICGSLMQGGNKKLSVNGILSQNALYGNMGSGSVFQIMQNDTYYMHLRTLAFFPRQLTDSEHIAITQP